MSIDPFEQIFLKEAVQRITNKVKTLERGTSDFAFRQTTIISGGGSAAPSTHPSLTNNPHNVTPRQLGMATSDSPSFAGLQLTSTLLFSGSQSIDVIDDSADTLLSIYNSDSTYKASLDIEKDLTVGNDLILTGAMASNIDMAGFDITNVGDTTGIDHGQLDGLTDNDHGLYDYDKTGWNPDRDYAISFVDGTRTFTITPNGTQEYWINNVEYSISNPDTVVITDTEGLWFIYYVGSTLTASQTPWNILDNDIAFVSTMMWDATNNEAIILGVDSHTWKLSAWSHYYHHFTEGTRYQSGLVLGDILAGENGNLDTHAQFSHTSGIILDEDIIHTIAEDTTPATIPIYYRLGANGDWRRITATNFPITTTGTGRGAWN
ncbi:hypothetical protein LCGC14_2035730, partial [marine sediment metagenome]